MVGRGDVIRRAAVDWDAVDAELQGIPSSFKEPRFDSVKHVLSLLSDERAEQELARVSVEVILLCGALRDRRVPRHDTTGLEMRSQGVVHAGLSSHNTPSTSATISCGPKVLQWMRW